MGPHPAARRAILTLPKKAPAAPPTPPVDSKARARKAKKARLKALGWLTKTYPAAFDGPVRPLAVGCGREITAAAKAAGMSARERKAIGSALHHWTRARSYREALCAPGAQRHGLDGQAVEPVSEEHREKVLAAP
jgi:sRNA-binding protein